MEMEEKCASLVGDLNHEKQVEVESVTRLAEEEFEHLKKQAQDDKQKVSMHDLEEEALSWMVIHSAT